jgi:hypothetical protein
MSTILVPPSSMLLMDLTKRDAVFWLVASALAGKENALAAEDNIVMVMKR